MLTVTVKGVAHTVETAEQAKAAGATDAQIAEALAGRRREAIYREIRRRIFAVATPTTQTNLAAAAAGGRLDKDAMAAYGEGLDWINAMRAAGKDLVEGDADYAADKHWPDVPDAVVSLIDAI